MLAGPKVLPAGDPGCYELVAPFPAAGNVTCSVPGGVHVDVPIAVEDYGAVRRVALPALRPVVLRHARTDVAARRGLVNEVFAFWSEDGRATADSPVAGWNPSLAPESETWWAPAASHHVTLLGADPMRLPWEPVVLPIPDAADGAPAVVHAGGALATPEGCGLVRVEVCCDGAPVALDGLDVMVSAEGWPAIRGMHRSGSALFTVPLDHGAAELAMRPGRCSIRIGPRIGEFEWTTVQVRAGSTHDVVLELLP
jgi:hypothetical protein